jgi:indole-3-glycerol phosphate synthase
MDVLEEIVAWKHVEVEQMKKDVSEVELHHRVEQLISEQENTTRISMRQALSNSDTGIIAEFKRKSPSLGWIKEEGKADIIPQSYQDNGATALSILTDHKYFGGCDEFIRTARKTVAIPILYKNFVIDEYQLFQARLCGANASLLIAADLEKDACKSLIHTAHDIGLEVLLEIHSEKELEYIDLEPDMAGINNRNLDTFITDVNNSFRLIEKLPKDMIKVSESGISNPDTVKKLKKVGFKGFLMGEKFMKAANPGAALKEFILELE